MILFFDTETTGKVDFRMPPDNDCQPNLVQLAAVLTEDDGTERGSFSFIVSPEGTEVIPPEAVAIHGITTEIARACGVSRAMAISVLDRIARRAEKLVAHSVDFDMSVLQTAWHRLPGDRAGPTFSAVHGRRATFCTMKSATPVARIPHANQRRPDDWKWPKLEECMRHFFNEEHTGAHDALADVRACMRVYFHLRQTGADHA